MLEAQTLEARQKLPRLEEVLRELNRANEAVEQTTAEIADLREKSAFRPTRRRAACSFRRERSWQRRVKTGALEALFRAIRQASERRRNSAAARALLMRSRRAGGSVS